MFFSLSPKYFLRVNSFRLAVGDIQDTEAPECAFGSVDSNQLPVERSGPPVDIPLSVLIEKTIK